MKVLVSLGFFDDSGEAQLVGVDLATGHSEVLLSYLPPPPLRVAMRGFTGACLTEDGSALYAAGHAAVYRIRIHSWTVDGMLHMPSFNDLHHVTVSEGQLYVSNTGSDCVDVFSERGRFVGSYMLTPPWVLASKMRGLPPAKALDVHETGWEFSQSAGVQWFHSLEQSSPISDEDDYHTAMELRAITPYCQGKWPDRLHPNHVCPLPAQTLVTCLQDGSIRDLRTLQVVYQNPGTYPHDGVVADGQFYFTTVDGRIWALPLSNGMLPPISQDRANVEPVPRTPVQCWDIAEQTGKHGWCRGLLIQPGPGGPTAVVGFTEVRQGRMPRYTWSCRSPEGSQTGLLWVELATGRQLGWANLSSASRHSKLYSVLPWSGY